jgi:hypothetical protein
MRFAMLLPMGVVVGVRLLLLARRSRQLPEIVLGSGLLIVAFAGLPLAAMGRIPATVGTPLGHTVFAVGIGFVMLGLALLYVFTWRVFRPDSRWALSFVVVAACVLAVVGFGIAYRGSQGSSLAEILPRTRGWALAIMAMVGLQFAWSAGESFLYFRSLRRRLALGLADPVVVNRFLLWGLSAAASALLCGGLALCVRVGMTILTDATPLNLIALTGSVASVSSFLTFFPPETYQRYLRRRVGQH